MNTDTSKSLTIQKLLTVLSIVIGIVLMILKVVTDSEPGAIPLLTIVIGAGCYFSIQTRIRSQYT